MVLRVFKVYILMCVITAEFVRVAILKTTFRRVTQWI